MKSWTPASHKREGVSTATQSKLRKRVHITYCFNSLSSQMKPKTHNSKANQITPQFLYKRFHMEVDTSSFSKEMTIF